MESDRQLRKASLLKGLEVIAGSPLAQTLVLQGGCALSFCYGSSRYTDDIDFADPTLLSRFEEYKQSLLSLGSSFAVNSVKEVFSGRGFRIKWSTQGEDKPLCRIDIDARYEGTHVRDTQIGLFVEPPQDIFADKIFANISRQEERRLKTPIPFKPSDLYDLYFIVCRLGFELPAREKIVQKARAYGKEELLTPENFMEMASRIRTRENHPLFVKDILTSLYGKESETSHFSPEFFNHVANYFERYR